MLSYPILLGDILSLSRQYAFLSSTHKSFDPLGDMGSSALRAESTLVLGNLQCELTFERNFYHKRSTATLP